MGCGSSSDAGPGKNATKKIKTADHYEQIKVLGVGASCKVVAVRDKADAKGTKYAMKILDKRQTYNKTLWEQECRILQTVKHKNILEYVDGYEDKNTYHILTVLCQGGELFDRVKNGQFTEKVAANLSRMMVESVAYCHQTGIVHRDLKPENFVFETDAEDSNMKLIDFGCAKQVQDDDVVVDVAGSPYYVAPEVLDSKRTRTGKTWKASDMWSVGVIIYLFVCGYPPFNSKVQQDIFVRIKRGKFKFPSDSEVKLTDSVKDLITRMLEKDVDRRMTAEEALAHPWIKGETASDTPLPLKVIEMATNFREQCRLKKAVGRVLGNNMTEDDKEELAKLFKKYDKNGDGKLGADEIADLMRHIGKGDKDAEAMLRNLDEDGDGAVDMSEFAVAQGLHKAAASEHDMKAAFEMFDVDGDGFVTHQEIEHLCNFLDPAKVKQLIQEVDESGDGRIDLNEWIKAMGDGNQILKRQKTEGGQPQK